MLALRYGYSTLSVLAVTTVLAGCGESLGPSGSSSAISRPPARSWMVAAAHAGSLLYISEKYSNVTNVYTYPAGHLAGSLTYPGPNYSGGLCSNNAGDVFITTTYAIYEYPHGGASPVATLSNGAGISTGCSVDPVTGDLAVATGNGAIAIYRQGPRYRWHLPRVFKIRYVAFDGYDAHGNLFVDGSPNSVTTFFMELAKGGSRFEKITLNGAPARPGNIEWDGRYLAIGDGQNLVIHRFAISGMRGTEVGKLRLAGPSQGEQFWIQGNAIIAPAYSHRWIGGFWRYPQGGFAFKAIHESSAYGATVSVAGGPASLHIKP